MKKANFVIVGKSGEKLTRVKSERLSSYVHFPFTQQKFSVKTGLVYTADISDEFHGEILEKGSKLAPLGKKGYFLKFFL